jgi:5-(carboxyamino)imidazole ribonucleotide synthase
MSAPAPLAPGDTIGILGSGQLGRMLAVAAARLGIRCIIYAPESGPACDVAADMIIAPYEDEAALADFAGRVRRVTYEFENVPASTAAFLAARLPVHPNPKALAETQDRVIEKRFLNGIGVPTAPFREVNSLADLKAALSELGCPAVLKTRRFGYDGKGQVMIKDTTNLEEAFQAVGQAHCVLEGFVPFLREVSVVGARAEDGAFAAYDVCENVHEHHILARTVVPAAMAEETATKALEMASRIARALDYVGVISVEMFLVGQGAEEHLVVNEIAPRVHNSGHWTLDGAMTSQFEQHIRAVCGFPLGSTRRHGRIVMQNLIGDQVHVWRDLMAERGACIHIYGKHEARAGRKMGHVTRVYPE